MLGGAPVPAARALTALALAMAGCTQGSLDAGLDAAEAGGRDAGRDAGRDGGRALDAGRELDAEPDAPPPLDAPDGGVDGGPPACWGTATLEGTPVPSPWLGLAYRSASGFVEPPRGEPAGWPQPETPVEERWRWYRVSDDLETVALAGTLVVDPVARGGATYVPQPTGALDPTALTTVVAFRIDALTPTTEPLLLGLYGLEDGAPRSTLVAPPVTLCAEVGCLRDGTRVHGGTHDDSGFSLAVGVEVAYGLGPWSVLYALDLDDAGAVLGAGWGTAFRRAGDVTPCDRAWCALVKDGHPAPSWAFQPLVVDRAGATGGAWTPVYSGDDWPVVARASATGRHTWFVLGTYAPRIFRMESSTGALDELGPIAIEPGARIWDGAFALDGEEHAALVVTIQRADGTHENRFLRAAVGAGIADEIALPDGAGEPFAHFLGDRWAIGYAGMLDEILCP